MPFEADPTCLNTRHSRARRRMPFKMSIENRVNWLIPDVLTIAHDGLDKGWVNRKSTVVDGSVIVHGACLYADVNCEICSW